MSLWVNLCADHLDNIPRNGIFETLFFNAQWELNKVQNSQVKRCLSSTGMAPQFTSGKYIHHHQQNGILLRLILRSALNIHSPSNSARDHQISHFLFSKRSFFFLCSVLFPDGPLFHSSTTQPGLYQINSQVNLT